MSQLGSDISSVCVTLLYGRGHYFVIYVLMYSLLIMQHTVSYIVRLCYITYLTLQYPQFCMQLTKAFVAETSCNQLLLIY